MVRAKVIAATIGGFAAAFVALLFDIDPDAGREVDTFVKAALAATGAFTAGYMKRETRG